MVERAKVLVCGASGFIGQNLIERFSTREDMEVSGTYFKTKPSGSIANNPKISLIKADLTKSLEVDKVIGDQDIVIQAAAVTSGSKEIVTKPYLHVTDNAVMNSLIFRAAYESGVKHLVFFSCTTMYPSSEMPVREDEFNYQIIDKYFGVGWTKVYLEKMCEFYSKIGPTKYTAIRHSNIYGPYDKYDLDKSHVFGATVTKVMTSQDSRLVVWGDGLEQRDLLYISDLTDFVERVLEMQKDPYDLVNVGSGEAVSIKELVEKIIKASGRDIDISYDLTKPTIKFNLTTNINRAMSRYGWAPSISLEEGIEKTLAWYKENILKIGEND